MSHRELAAEERLLDLRNRAARIELLPNPPSLGKGMLGPDGNGAAAAPV